MTAISEVYKCQHCTNVITVMGKGAGTLVCCNDPMKHMEEGVTDAAKEKHVPVIEKLSNGYKVKVGSVAHPMEEKHWIQWIELVADGEIHSKMLNPGDAPEAVFLIPAASKVSAREYCNLHGLWKAEA